MRYSKLLFVLVLTLILVFGSSMSAFATRGYDIDYYVWPNNSGTISGSSQYIDYAPGTEISITANPKSGYIFSKWKVDAENDGQGSFYVYTATYTFNIGGDTECTAYFEKTYYINVSVYSSSNGMGTVSGTEDYKKDDMVPVQAYPNDGYRLWIVKLYDKHPNEENLTPSQPSSFDNKMPDNNVDLFALIAENPDLTILVDPDDPAIGEVTGATTEKVLPSTSITLATDSTVRSTY